MIEVSPAASEAIAAFMKEKDLSSPLRIFLQSGGCGGPSLRLVMDEKKDGDQEVQVDGQTYLIEENLSKMSGKVTVEFVDNGWQKGFAVNSEYPVGGGSSCSSGGGCDCCG
ncbi:MAG: adhesin [Desulfarculus sp.]|jgi:Fe-S cluster assembly iron-binding protein IscA|nr:MAG: adhesin [Desulfarculus sp.]